MKVSRRIKDRLLSILGVLALNIVFQRDWGSVLFGVTVYFIGASILPYIITFMSNDKQDSRYK